MPLIIEDGTGVPGADSMVTVQETVDYTAGRALSFPTEAALQEAAIREAAEYLQNEHRYAWRGTRAYYEQTMPWPRVGATEYRGPAVPVHTVPWRVKQAQMYLAHLASLAPGTLDMVLERGGKVKSKTIGPISTTWMDDAPVEKVIQKVQGLVQPLLRTGRLELGVPIFEPAPVPDPDVFKEDFFNNPGSGT